MPEQIPTVLENVAPDVVINCAAYTRVDDAETAEAEATIVNGSSVGVIAEWAASRGRPFVTFSTDYVFDGTATRPYLESSPTKPINAYGRSKLVGEQLTLQAGGLVIRTSWLMSGTHPNFVATILTRAAERELKVVDDQRGSPTVVDDLAGAALAAVSQGMTGLLHLTNQGVATWYELATTALAEFGLDASRVKPCTSEEFPRPAPRPSYSVLGTERSRQIAGLPHWRESLPGVIAELKTWI